MFNTIVVGTDGSKGALEALAVAGELARTVGASDVHVVTAAAAYSRADIKHMESKLPAEFHDLISPHITAEDRFVQADDVLRPYGVRATRHEHDDGAADAILDVANDVHAELIVVGARGLSPVGRFFRGSVSTKVAHHSPCSVLIVEHAD